MPTYEYKVAIGHDNTAGLTTLQYAPLLVWEPHATITEYSRVTMTLSARRQADGYLRTAWNFGSYLTLARWQRVMTQIGLLAGGVESEDALVTVRTRGIERAFANYNAIIYHPHAQFVDGYFRDVAFDLLLLEAL